MAEGFHVMDALRTRYAAPEYALFEEVRNGTGFTNVTRTADAVAMSLWPSRGLELHGFEVKVSRGDWLREKKAPEKAEEISRYCDRWWLVVSDESIVQDGELPPTWGLLVPRGKKLVSKVEAPKREAQPLTRSFLAALFRKASQVSATEAEIERRATGLAKAKEAALRADIEHQTGRDRHELERLKKAVAEFEAASGVKVNEYWGGGDIGEAVRFVRSGGVRRAQTDLKHLKETADSIAEYVGRALNDAKQLRLVDVDEGGRDVG